MRGGKTEGEKGRRDRGQPGETEREGVVSTYIHTYVYAYIQPCVYYCTLTSTHKQTHITHTLVSITRACIDSQKETECSFILNSSESRMSICTASTRKGKHLVCGLQTVPCPGVENVGTRPVVGHFVIE